MQLMHIFAALVGFALLAGEFARRGAAVLLQAKALDDVLAGLVLLALGLAGTRAAPALHAAGWALFTGVMLSTLAINLDAWLQETAKPRAGFYAGLLAAMVVAGTAASLWWARRR